MALNTYNEGSAVTVTARFLNGTSPVTPLSVRYRVDCETTQTVLRDWTTATAATSVAISVPASLNQMQDEGHVTERKVVTVEANYGTDSAFVGRFKYDVRNLQGV